MSLRGRQVRLHSVTTPGVKPLVLLKFFQEFLGPLLAVSHGSYGEKRS